MRNPLKIIQVGVGKWGWTWVPIILESAEWELVGIVDIDKKKADEACKYYNLDTELCFSTIEEALRVIEADAVLVAVPPEAHRNVTISAIEKGLHCLVEKPLANTIREAQDIVEYALHRKCKLMVSQNYRFKKVPQTVKELIRRRVIGEIGTVYVDFQKSPVFSGFRTKMPEPLLRDMAIHHFDLMRAILGLEPIKIVAYSWNPSWSWFDGNAVAVVLIEMSNGAIVNYRGSWVSKGWETTWDGDWHIQGEDGEIFWANNEVIVRPTDISKTVFMEGALERNGQMQAELVGLQAQDREAVLFEFASAIKEDREPETSGSDNIKSLSMVLGACKSIELKRPVDIRELVNRSL